MNILFMCHGLIGGGAERVCVCWANGLVKLGHSVIILTESDNHNTYNLDPQIRIINWNPKVGNIPKLSILLGKLYSIPLSYKIFQAEKIDIVINLMFYYSLGARISTWILNKPMIMTDHSSLEHPAETPLSLMQRFNKFYESRLYDKYTVLTRQDKSILDSKGLRNGYVLHNPLFLTPTATIPIKKHTILSVGRLDSFCKGFDILAQAWSKIASKYPDWELKIIGNGSEKDKTKILKYAGNAQNFSIEPFTTEIEKEYRQASLFVLSSRYEGWGMALVEAMSQGCASIACDYKGRQAEIIDDNVNGLLCEPDNIDMLIEKIELLINDEGLRIKLQKASPDSVKRFSEDLVAQRLESVINSCIKKH